MPSTLRKSALLLLGLSLACAVPQLLAKKKDRDKDKAADSALSEQKRAMQALNRLAFGPRPGDVDQVIAMGVDRDRSAVASGEDSR